jgi:hypothetical protein
MLLSLHSRSHAVLVPYMCSYLSDLFLCALVEDYTLSTLVVCRLSSLEY